MFSLEASERLRPSVTGWRGEWEGGQEGDTPVEKATIGEYGHLPVGAATYTAAKFVSAV